MFAWAHGVTVGEALALAARFPGLGLVLYPTNYGAAVDLAVPPIAYATTIEHARAIHTLATTGTPFTAILVNDERNASGASGHYLTPDEYAATFTPIRDELRGIVPVHTMGLMPIGGFIRTTLRARRFDRAYHNQLPEADGRAWNPNKVRLSHIRRTLDTTDGPWVLSPAPFRGWFDRLLSPVGVRQWAALSRRPDVTAVALWCLREVHGTLEGRWQHEHGLIDRNGDLTNVGRAVLDSPQEGSSQKRVC